MAKENEKVTLATSVENISAELLEQIKAEAKAEALKEAEAKATEEAQKAVESERARVAELDKYASLPQSEVKALAEKAKADGTSLEEFNKQFNTLAFDLLKKSESAVQTEKSSKAMELKDEADESAKIEGSVEVKASEETPKTDFEKGAELAKSLKARFSK